MMNFKYLRKSFAGALCFAAPLVVNNAKADQVFNDDVIITFSLCVGNDCVNGESFGFDTIRLKENNTRIKFDDTSNSSSFPNNDWQLTANDTANGGDEKFSIDDVTNGRTPFTIRAGARTNSLYVDGSGRIGVGTRTPVLRMHMVDGNSPALRLEQDGSSGFTPQTWDVAGNEANFFVRDATNGSKLPFKIFPNAPTNALIVEGTTGDIGVGIQSPLGRLHVSGSGSARQMMVLEQTTAGTLWTLANYETGASEGAGNFGINQVGGGTRLLIDTSGNIRLPSLPSCSGGIQTAANGQLSCIVSSSRFKSIKGDLTPEMALANVMALRPQIGAYKATPNEPEHWLIAEEVAAVDPALVGRHDGKPYTVKTQNIVADLVGVVQHQQRLMVRQQSLMQEQQEKIEALELAISK